MITFFHLLNLSVLNSFILLTSSGSKLSHQNFRLASVRDLTQDGGGGALTTDHPTRKNPSTSKPTRLDIRHTEHQPSEGK
jgi:hypothetical protein